MGRNDKDLALLSSRGSHSVFPDLRGGTQSAASFELGIERRNPLTREFSPASLGIDYWERAVQETEEAREREAVTVLASCEVRSKGSLI